MLQSANVLSVLLNGVSEGGYGRIIAIGTITHRCA